MKQIKKCIACDMPMEKPSDFAAGDITKNYCHYCAREDGSMKSYEEWLEGNIPWAMKEFNLTEQEARDQGIAFMKNMPAWKDKN